MLFAPSFSRFPRLEPLPRESFESLLSRPQGTERRAFLFDGPPIRPSASNPDGTVKKGSSTWNTSNRGRRTAAKLAEHHRCLAATRKRDHGELVNDLLQIGGTIKIEKNNYRSFQRCFGRSTNRRGMGEFVEHLKRKAESAGCEVIELNAYKLKMSQYDPATDAYRKKPLKERWHRWGNTGTLVQRDAMSAFLACHATEKGHDRALLLEKWTTAEALLSGSGLCRHEPCSDPEVSKDTSGLTKPNCGSKAERERGLPRTLCTDGDVQAALPPRKSCLTVKVNPLSLDRGASMRHGSFGLRLNPGKSEHQRVNGPGRSILVNSGTIFPKLHALLGI